MRSRDPGFLPLLATQAASNTCTAMNTFIAVWLLSTPSLPPILLGANQALLLATLMVGNRMNPAVVRRFGLRRGTITLLVVEGLGLAALGLWIFTQATPVPTMGAALGIIVLGGLVAFVSGANGPSYVAVVARWGGNQNRSSRRLMADSAAFQIAATLGPLAGSLFAIATSLLWLLPWLNLLTNAAAAGVLWRGTAKYPLTEPDKPRRTDAVKGASDAARGAGRRSDRRTGLLRHVVALSPATLLVLAGFVDPLRTVLPLLVREVDGSSITLAYTSAALAAGAAFAAVVASDRPWAVRVSGWAAAGGTLIVLGAAALLWLVGGTLVTFAVGGALLGVGSATLYGQLMSDASHTDQEEGGETGHVARAILLRALISSAGGFILASGWGQVAWALTAAAAGIVLAVGCYRVTRTLGRGLRHDPYRR